LQTSPPQCFCSRALPAIRSRTSGFLRPCWRRPNDRLVCPSAPCSVYVMFKQPQKNHFCCSSSGFFTTMCHCFSTLLSAKCCHNCCPESPSAHLPVSFSFSLSPFLLELRKSFTLLLLTSGSPIYLIGRHRPTHPNPPPWRFCIAS